MNKKEKLEELFREFPGVGPRQAKRFVHSLLYKNKNYLDHLSSLILDIKKDLKRCSQCNRFFHSEKLDNTCSVCLEIDRNREKILILEKTPDFENIQKLNI